MTTRKTALTLRKLSMKSEAELESMVAELTSATACGTGTDAKRAQWARRFSASGKMRPAAPIRLF